MGIKENNPLNALLKKSLIKEAPISVATFTKDLVFINNSDEFLKEFNIKETFISGLPIMEVLTELPKKLFNILKKGTKGIASSSEGSSFSALNKAISWYKWSVKPWRTEENEIGGIILVIEDITAKKREEELLLSALRVAKIGGWEVDLVSNTIFWTQITREIHEVPSNFEPDLATGINFYKEGYSRDTITKLLNESIQKGGVWDVALQLVTFTGREIWVRAKGEAQMKRGKCVRLIGTFQDIDHTKKIDLAFKTTTERL